MHGFPESMQKLIKFKEKVSITYANKTLLTSIGAKNKLYTTSRLLSKGNALVYRKTRTIFR